MNEYAFVNGLEGASLGSPAEDPVGRPYTVIGEAGTTGGHQPEKER